MKVTAKVPYWLCKAKGWPKAKHAGQSILTGEIAEKTAKAVLFVPDDTSIRAGWLPLSRVELIPHTGSTELTQ